MGRRSRFFCHRKGTMDRGRKREYHNLRRPGVKTGWWVLAIFAVVYYFFYNFDFTALIGDASMEALESSGSIAVNVYAGLGAAAILPAFIENFVANGVAEEILYRGFLWGRKFHRDHGGGIRIVVKLVFV